MDEAERIVTSTKLLQDSESVSIWKDVTIVVIIIYSLIYFWNHIRGSQYKERLRATGVGLIKFTALLATLIAIAWGVRECVRFLASGGARYHINAWTAIALYLLMMGYVIFREFLKAVSGDSGHAANAVERGRNLGTVDEAREAIRQQEGEPHNRNHRPHRSLVARFVDLLLGPRQ